MNEHRLGEILTAYGSDPARWPVEERKAAKALLAHRTALASHAAEAALDRLLVQDRIPGASSELRARIAAIPFAPSQAKPNAVRSAPPRGWRAWLGLDGGLPWKPIFAPTAALLLLAAAAGFTAGYRGLPSPLAAGDDSTAAIFAAEDGGLLPLSEDGS